MFHLGVSNLRGKMSCWGKHSPARIRSSGWTVPPEFHAREGRFGPAQRVANAYKNSLGGPRGIRVLSGTVRKEQTQVSTWEDLDPA